MAFNKDRFVVIDGVQMSRERAKRLGLKVPGEKKASDSSGPSENKARTSSSARSGGGSKATTKAGDDDTSAA